MSERERSQGEGENSLDPEVAAATRLTQQMEAGRVEFDKDGNLQDYDLEGLERLARLYSRTKMVPEHFQGQIADCAVAIQMAIRCGVDIMPFLQSCYIVRGKPAIDSKMMIALLNKSSAIKGRVKFEHTGDEDERACRAVVTDSFGEQVVGPAVTWEMATLEKWNEDKPIWKNGKKVGTQVSKWRSMPELMFKYRAAAFLIRTSFPDVLLGMPTTDELDDMQDEIVLDKAPLPQEFKAADQKQPRLTGGQQVATSVLAVARDEPDVVDQSPPEEQTFTFEDFADAGRQALTLEELEAVTANALRAFPQEHEEVIALMNPIRDELEARIADARPSDE